MSYKDIDPNTVVLPQWLNDLLPAVREPTVIDYINNTYVVVSPLGEHLGEFDDVEAAYDFAYNYNHTTESSGGVKISPNIPETNGEDASFTVSKSFRLLMGLSDVERLNLIRYPYGVFQEETVPFYRDNPDDFYASYCFLDTHPALWTQDKKYVDDKDYPHWETNGCAMRLWHMPSRRKDGTIVHSMEAGGHVLPDCTSTYHDLRLDVNADSYEDAIIQTAALVDKFFNVDGTERENVVYEKSELEKTLEERLKELEGELKSNEEKEVQ